MPMKIWIPPIARRWQTRRRTAKALPSMPNTPRFSTWMGSDPRVLDAYRQQELYTYWRHRPVGHRHSLRRLVPPGVSGFPDRNGPELGDEALYESQYKQLQSTPCAFQPYYVGYEEFMALRRKAEKELGDSFNQKAFHEAILKSGCRTVLRGGAQCGQIHQRQQIKGKIPGMLSPGSCFLGKTIFWPQAAGTAVSPRCLFPCGIGANLQVLAIRWNI